MNKYIKVLPSLFVGFSILTGFQANAEEQKLGKEDLIPLAITSNDNSGIPNARYTGTTENGVTFGFDFQIGEREKPV